MTNLSKYSYLVTFKNFKIVPQKLSRSIESTICLAYRSVRVSFDFGGRYTRAPSTVEISNEIPLWPVFGERSEFGIYVYVRYMKESVIMRYAGNKPYFLSSGKMKQSCSYFFINNQQVLGSMIANTIVHELAHELGLNTGGHDNGGHVKDKNNYMWHDTIPNPKGRRHPFIGDSVIVYTVTQKVSLRTILNRYITGNLTRCFKGGSALKPYMILEHPQNQKPGFLGHAILEKKCSAHVITPGIMVALPQIVARPPELRRYLPAWTGPKNFTARQKAQMNRHIDMQFRKNGKRVALG
jgi:hypothetical protein